MDRFIGAQLDGRYELLEVIGVGGTAVVYKAKDHRLNRYVAVKILKDEYARDEEFRRQFHDEAQAVAMLSQQNIVNVFDVSRSGNVEYIVMELIDGITLKEYLSRRGRLTPREVTVFATQIARALEHAHNHNIIHRDIKPQNIMLLRDGTVKVADFGIAHFATRDNTYSKGEAIGSVHYVSPEQAKGSFVDNRTDLYSLGVVMYEMITGRLPFEGDTPVSIALQHINSIALPPSVFAEDVPPQLEAITMKAMNPALSKRYATAGQILDDLEAFQNEQQFKIVIPSDPVIPDENPGIDATRKIQNTGEVELSHIPEEEGVVPAGEQHPEKEEKKEEHVEKKSGRKNRGKRSEDRERSPWIFALIFAILCVGIFVGGAYYFIRNIVDPFGYSNGNGRLSAPNLVGLYYTQVISDPAYSDFVIEEGEYVYNEKVDAGKIISQDPKGNRPLEKGGTITVTISRGTKTFALPNYEGSDARQAKIELDRLGITCIEGTPEYNDEVPNGMVLRQDPAPNTILTEGDTVTIIVSKGPEFVTTLVPDLLGKPEAEALALLEAAQLEWGDPTYIEQEGTPGLVVYQSVAAGTEVEAGTSITYQLSKEPEVIEPDPVIDPDPAVDPNPVTPVDPTPPQPTGNVYNVKLMDSDGAIALQVYLDYTMIYNGTHYSSEGTVPVRITETGSHTVYVYQNGILTAMDKVSY